MKKKMVTVLLTAAMVTAMAAGCGKSSDSGSDKKESYTIGIEQFAEHGSLDNCREGFLKGLEDEGIKEGDNLTVKYKMQRQIWELQNRFPTVWYLIK